jgi:hypothetical protein
MSQSRNRKSPLRWALVGLGMSVALGVSGCQYQVGGQTLPSPYYMSDDVQYFAPGPEFKLEKEASALRQARADQMLPRQ